MNSVNKWITKIYKKINSWIYETQSDIIKFVYRSSENFIILTLWRPLKIVQIIFTWSILKLVCDVGKGMRPPESKGIGMWPLHTKTERSMTSLWHLTLHLLRSHVWLYTTIILSRVRVLAYQDKRGCCALFGRFFTKKSLNMGSIFYKIIPKNWPHFLQNYP